MKCFRCSGEMVEEQIFTLEGGTPMARCVYCGNSIDAVVISNRLRSPDSLRKSQIERAGWRKPLRSRRPAVADK